MPTSYDQDMITQFLKILESSSSISRYWLYTHLLLVFEKKWSETKKKKKKKSEKDIYYKKLFNLSMKLSKISHDHQMVVFNYSPHVLTGILKSLLCKGLNLVISPDKLEYS